MYLRSFCAALAGCFTFANPVSSATVDYGFTASFDRSFGTVTNTTILSLGTSVSGSLTYDTTAADFRTDRSNFGSYFQAGDLFLDGVSLGTPTAARDRVTVSDGVSISGSDVFTIEQSFDTSLLLQFSMRDASGSVFQSDALPSSLNLADFDLAYVGIYELSFATGSAQGNIVGGREFTLTSLQPPAVPLPAGGVLLLTGCLALMWRRRPIIPIDSTLEKTT